MAKAFASTGDLEPKTISFTEIGDGCFAYTAEGDPNSGVVIGRDSVLVVDAQATPVMAEDVIARIRTVTDKPIRHLVLTHYHAVRVLGAAAYRADEILASTTTRDLIVERGQQDWDSEYARFPRLFQAAETVPGLTWPTLTFDGGMSIWLDDREVRLVHLGRGHTAGDIAVWVPDAGVMFAGDLVEYKSACYCGDAHLADWPATLDRMAAYDVQAMVPGRGAALTSRDLVREGIALTRDFIEALYASVRKTAEAGGTLKDAFDAARTAMAPRFGDFVIFEHCLPFNVSRAYDEAKGIDHPRIWTDARDRELWESLEG